MRPAARLLLVDDEPIIHEVFQELVQGQYALDGVFTAEEALRRLRVYTYDVVLLDIMLPDRSGEEVLESMMEMDPDLPVIIITAYGTVDGAVRCLKWGAFDYITKPFRNEEVLAAIQRAVRHRKVIMENRALRQQMAWEVQFEHIVGKSTRMREIYDLIHRVAASRSTVLILGESGTGKDLIARAIHYRSPRADQPFVVVNTSNIPAELLESELFGYEKGAFTGAMHTKPGLLEMANGGTVFLDEVATMPLSTQAKLLRVLQDRQFMRLGGLRTIEVDVRFITASNQDLEQLVREGRFREDLYYRLNVIVIRVPPLRERWEDIPLLVEHFLRKYGQENQKPDLELTERALTALVDYHWPGNVRELEHTIERAVVLATGPVIDIDLLPEHIVRASRARSVHVSSARSGTQRLSFRERVDNFKKALILEALRESGGVQRRAAELLKIKPTTLHEMIKRYNIRLPASPSSSEEPSPVSHQGE